MAYPLRPFAHRDCRVLRVILVLLALSIGTGLFFATGVDGGRSESPHSSPADLAHSDADVISASAAAPLSKQRLAGPYPALPLRIIDGDTVEMRVAIWLGQEVTTRVRLRGIDAPELRARCEAERIGADAAKLRLEALLKTGPVYIADIGYDKYGTRVVARLLDAAHADLGQRLVEERLARPYAGGKRQGWCDGAALAAKE